MFKPLEFSEIIEQPLSEADTYTYKTREIDLAIYHRDLFSEVK